MQSSSKVVTMKQGKTKSARKEQTREQEDQWVKYSKGSYNFAPFKPLSENQQLAYESALINHLTLAIGPAGTGKSYSGAGAAVQLLAEGAVKKIIITRSPLPTGQTAGFRPGDTYEKLIPYLMPLIQTLKKVMRTDKDNDGLFNYLWEKHVIEIQDLETIKGMSFDDTFLIVEEAQECDMEQLKNLLTRASDSCYIFVNGDTKQANKRLRDNALDQYVSNFRDFNAKLENGELNHLAQDGDMPKWVKPFNIVEFTKSDRNGRGDFCRLMLEVNDMYDM